MHLYPQLPRLRARQAAGDLLVLLTIGLFAALGWAVRSALMTLTTISDGFTAGATDAQQALQGTGDALSGVPLIGDDIEASLDGMAAATFGSAVQTGEAVTDAVTLAAAVVGAVTFAAPTALLLVLWLPRRLDRARAWDAAHVALGSRPAVAPRAAGTSGSPEGHDTLALPAPGAEPAAVLTGNGYPPEELLALRALCHLPLVELAPFCVRPFEAFAAGDYAPLVAALYAHEGLVAPGGLGGSARG